MKPLQGELTSISLKDFALTGHFGPVTLGMTKDDLITLLGEPDGIQDFGDTVDVHYSWYEFFCLAENGKIIGIQNDHLCVAPLESRRRMVENHRLNICFENERFLFDPWFLKPGINISYFQVIELLRAETISFEESFIDISGWRIVFPSGVYIDFDYERHSEFKDDPPIDKAHLVVNAMRMFDWGI